MEDGTLRKLELYLHDLHKKIDGTPEKFMSTWKKTGQAVTATKTEYKAGNWYRVKEPVAVCNGYYGEHGRYIYLSNQIKTSCDNKSGIGYHFKSFRK